MKSISVIIPTKDRPDELARLLNSIDSHHDRFDDLIVIDSSKDNHLEKNRYNTLAIGGKHIVFMEKGVSKARNKGIEESDSNILVFVDDDFIVTNGWISKLVDNFGRDNDIMCVTGRMLSYRQDAMSNLYEKSMSFDRGNEKRVFTIQNINLSTILHAVVLIGNKRLFENTPVPWSVGYGFSSFRRRIFDEIGLFDVNMGRGSLLVGAEDVDFFYRILKNGHKIVYEPEAMIYHDHRQTLARILKDAYYAGISIKALTTKYYSSDPYMFLCFWGAFFLNMFSIAKAHLKLDRQMTKMIAMELKGFLMGERYRVAR